MSTWYDHQIKQKAYFENNGLQTYMSWLKIGRTRKEYVEENIFLILRKIMITTEQDVQNLSRLEESKKGHWITRNNVGVFRADTGRPVRTGLANESARMNELIKSGDLIGIKEIVITQDMVGQTIGQFISREIKKPGWKYSGTPREKAQVRWANMVNRKGGDAKFVTYNKDFGLVDWVPDKEVMV